MERFLCIHGHFYQPPRENPWLESVEIQDSAYPYHDWNERITAQCYAANTACRNLDSEHRIIGIVSNYARISFNFGPTLLSWMEKNCADTYRAIQDADQQSMLWRSGHGAALAQVFNHVIMPLASLRDKRTQVRWGIRDFEQRFQRFPEGMWLAETAVDIETLEILAEENIRFTILAPHQAGRVRKIGVSEWKDVSGAQIDPSQAYLCRLPSGRSVTLFFYDGTISQAVAFEKLLSSGERFADRLISGFSEESNHPQLVHIATDGETYGHHHAYGEMALGYALKHIEENRLARLTNYGEYLELHPASHEVEIIENTSWSCAHGIERWRNDCGCNSGGSDAGSQQWREPLRDVMDWLSGQLAGGYEDSMAAFVKDPWEVRNDYINVMHDRSGENVAAFLQRHALHCPLDEAATVAVLCLLEMQRHAMLMYTSCGWFFDDLSGLETVQIIQYASRAMQLSELYCIKGLEPLFLELLALAESNLPEQGNGAQIYSSYVIPAMIDLFRVGTHYAVSFVFEEYGEETDIFSYRAGREDFQILHAGQLKLAVGKIFIRSSITRKSARISFCNLYFGGHAMNCGVCTYPGEEAYLTMKQEVAAAFNQSDFAIVIRLIDTHFGTRNYCIKDLFRDEQRQILRLIIAGTLQEFEEKYISLYENSKSLMGFVRETGKPLPKYFMTTAETALNLKLQKMFVAEAVDPASLKEDLEEITSWNISLDKVPLEFFIRRKVEEEMTALLEDAHNDQRLKELIQLIEAAALLPLEVNLWQTQNKYWTLLQSCAPELRSSAGGASGLISWSEAIKSLGQLLFFNVPETLAAAKGDI